MSAPMETLAEVTRGRTDAMLEAIRELVEQSSHTADKAGGDAVASLLAERAAGLGLEVTRIASERFADHLVIASPAAAHSAEGAIVFVGHHDTVFPRGSFEGFTRDATIARGPGVLDMKGGIVVMLEAVRAVQQAGGLPRLKLRIVLVGDEEVGSPEGRAVIQTHTKGASQALVFEAGRAADKIITSRKGTGSATVIATGKAAHAANGHREGVNAIWALARFIDRAQRLTDYERGVTVNVGIVRGGEAKNTVPDRAECQIDFRFVRMSDADTTFEELKRACEEAAREVPGSSLTISGGPQRLPLERNAANTELYERYAAEAKAVGLGSEESGLIAGGSDASSTAAIGIPSIDGLGPRGSGFHTKDELIEIASLEPKALALARFIWKYGGC